ncbi:hypothetical protein Lal_00000051 [Lupinus albus]|nr:hypothetical protein Lal_00000051 [Lupinus albus]
MGFGGVRANLNCLGLKVGIPKFVNGIRKGVESHVAKLENIPKCSVYCYIHLGIYLDIVNLIKRKLTLKYAHKYRLGLWRPRTEPIKA